MMVGLSCGAVPYQIVRTHHKLPLVGCAPRIQSCVRQQNVTRVNTEFYLIWSYFARAQAVASVSASAPARKKGPLGRLVLKVCQRYQDLGWVKQGVAIKGQGHWNPSKPVWGPMAAVATHQGCPMAMLLLLRHHTGVPQVTSVRYQGRQQCVLWVKV